MELPGGLRPVALSDLSVSSRSALPGSAWEKAPLLPLDLACLPDRGGQTTTQNEAEQAGRQEPPGSHRRHNPGSETSLPGQQVAGARSLPHDLLDSWIGRHDQCAPHSPLLGREKKGRMAENGRRNECDSCP